MIPRLTWPDSGDVERFRRDGEYQTRRTVDIAELKRLLAEGHFDHYSHPYGWDVLLELYRWMVWSARRTGPAEETQWGTSSAFADVGDYHSCTGVKRPRPFGAEWKTDLVQRLRFALWSDGDLVSEWRRRARLDPPRKLVLPGPFAKWGPIESELKVLFWCAHPLRRLTVALNHCHPGARQPVRVDLYPGKDGWCASLWYGYAFTPHNASWNIHCAQHADEPLVTFVGRASGLFESLLAPCDLRVPTSEPSCSGTAGLRAGSAGCGHSWAAPAEEDFALISACGAVSVVRARTAGDAWQPETRVLYGRGGDAWKKVRGQVSVDYASDIGLQEAADMFAKAEQSA